MRRSLAALVLSLAAAMCPAGVAAALGEDEARGAAATFGRALTKAEPAGLGPVLPERGKVRLRLAVLGPAEGSFSRGQVQALIQDFLRQGRVRSWELIRVECDRDRYALAHGRAGVTDRRGRSVELELHLTFQPEEGRWVLREVRESSP